MQVAQVAGLAAVAHDAGDRQKAAAGADAGDVEGGDIVAAEACGAGSPQHLQGGSDIGQQGGIFAIQFGVQHAVGQSLDALGIEAGQPRQIVAGSFGRGRGDGGNDLQQALAPERITLPGLRRQGRHAVFAGAGQLGRIGQSQHRQGLQGLVLGTGDGGEKTQPVA